MSRSAIAALLLVCLLPHRSNAEPKRSVQLKLAPWGKTMGSEREHASMKMDCEGEPPFRELVCSFYTVTIARERVPPDLDAQVEKAMGAIRDEGGWTKRCAEIAAGTRRDVSLSKNEPVERAQLVSEAIKVFEQQCVCADDPCRRAALRKLLASQYEGVCKIYRFASLPQHFKRTGDRTWMSTGEAIGCNVVTVAVLEHEPDSDSLWTLTQTRTGKPDVTNSLCAGWEVNKPAVYSWRFDPDTLLECRAINFQ